MEAPIVTKILVAEDDPVMAKLLEFNLIRESFAVTICRNGKDVIPTIIEQQPDLMLLDCVMPGATGLEILKSMSELDAVPDIPVIMVTGQGRESVKNNLIEAGARAVYTKPFSTIALMQEIREQLAGSKAGS